MKRFDIVVCTRNNESTIRQCIERILKCAAPHRLIVIDGKSSDRTTEIASQLGAEIYSDDGNGLGYARNMALKLSISPLLGFVDADALIPNNWLSLHEHFKDPNVATASAATIYGYGNPPLQKLYEWLAKTSNEDAGFVGTIVRREAIIEAGGIREDLQAYEDWELKTRLKNHGMKWVWDRKVVIHHPLSMRSYLSHVRHWGKGAGKSGVAAGKRRTFLSFAGSPIVGLKLAYRVHPIHAVCYPMMRLAFLTGYLEAG